MKKLFLLIMMVVFTGPVLGSQPFFVPKGPLVYDVIRKGDTIGEQRVDFQDRPDQLIVNTSSMIAVSLLGITVYRFDQTTEETWKEGKLLAYKANAVDGGTKKDLELHREGETLAGTYNGKKRQVPGDVIPSVLWRADSVKANVILDAINGKAKQTKAQEMGDEQIKVGDKMVSAKHYRFDGEFKRDVWYDERGYMVKAILVAKDGSEVTQQLQHLP